MDKYSSVAVALIDSYTEGTVLLKYVKVRWFNKIIVPDLKIIIRLDQKAATRHHHISA